MRPLHVLGFVVVIGWMLADREPLFAKGGHGGHGHGGHHHSHGHGGHGHHGHSKHAHAHHTAAHGSHRHGGHAFAHHHGVHNRHHPRHHAAWSHHYANHHHGWGHHYGWGYHHGYGWGWNGWNWYGGGVVGPSYVDNGYVAPNVSPNVVVQNPPVGATGFLSLVGTIRSIRGTAIAVASEDGDPVMIDATPDTKIVLNSRQATLTDLRPEDRVKGAL